MIKDKYLIIFYLNLIEYVFYLISLYINIDKIHDQLYFF